MEYHVPVLLNECIQGLNIKPDGIYVDVTFGGGGHSREILKHLNKNGKLFAFDQDLDSLNNIPPDQRFKFIHGNFRFITNHLYYFGIDKVDGILADFGISSHQIDIKERGFSFRLGGDLDMRMNKYQKTTAKDIINTYSIEKLTEIFRKYGEINKAHKLAYIIVNYRKSKTLETVEEFVELIKPQAQKFKENKFFAQVFQAIRIEVNSEIDALKEFLLSVPALLNKNGRIVTITYHSIEDRIVKSFLKYGNFDSQLITDSFGNAKNNFKFINNKVITPKEEEIINNPRSRSAKLRIAEKL